MTDKIIIKGARENNLKNINLEIPRNKFIVFTGVSGSGKSTLAFDTIFAEGQRKFMESLSSYARQFIGQIQKPDVDSIEGLSPAISIEQKTTSNNPRSTVGTITEINDYLRLLFSSIGTVYCPNCKKPISMQTVDEIVDKVLKLENDSKITVNAPIIRGEKGAQEKLFENLKKNGYVRVNVDGNIYSLDEDIELDKNKKHNISVVVDRLIVKPEIESRLTESIESAVKLSKGLVIIDHNGEQSLFSTTYSCSECGYSFEEISPRLFSFNNAYGACPDCLGLGYKEKLDVDLVVKWDKSINQGALSISGWNMDNASFAQNYFKALSKRYKFSLDVPVKELPIDIMNILLYGNDEQLNIEYSSSRFSGNFSSKFEGIITNLARRYKETTSDYVKQEIQKYMKVLPCPTCKGARLKPEPLNVLIDGKNIADVSNMSVDNLYEWVDNLNLTGEKYQIAYNILKEIKARINFLINVGLSYLTLSRSSGSLSGGESQRIRLATQIGSGLVGVLYILDEPSIGLHQRDNQKLLDSLKALTKLGNTLIVVEHDEDTIRQADYVVDIGPLAGVRGGEVVAQGTVEDILKAQNSVTQKYLSGELKIEVPSVRRKIGDSFIQIIGAKQNNLKNINVDIPVGLFTVVTGVSGSGKSSLINDILFPATSNLLNRSKLVEGDCKEVIIPPTINKVIDIDQTPIGRTPRSNTATYTGVFTAIRELFAKTSDAKERGYNSGRFSFNISGGRCEACGGDGIKKIEMFFLPDVYVPCEVCKGTRYNRETLQVKYKGKNIYDVLEMTVEKALDFFQNVPQIKNKLQAIYDVGLGYIKLGQSATTLSGGEAQRVKLSSELCKKSTGRTLYILDEPTTGLHSYDVDKLIKILQALVDGGNTCVVIEHNLDVIKVADYIIDLGKEGGNKGGEIVAVGTPEEIANNKQSVTGQFLKRKLEYKK